MLSLLIPVFDEAIVPLATELDRQCREAGIRYEILFRGDHPQSSSNAGNFSVNEMANCRFDVNASNVGRAENRNLLADSAVFDYLLFLDGDTFPERPDFIQNYLSALPCEVAFGGLSYAAEPPANDQLLRWAYGKKREALPVAKRNAAPFKNALTSNLLVRRDIFLPSRFDAAIRKYGFEDAEFLKRLERKGTTLRHIDNPVIHLGIETTSAFLGKTRESLVNLAELYRQNRISTEESRVIAAYENLEKKGLLSLFVVFYKISKRFLLWNLASGNPSMFIFDLYKLGYFSAQRAT